MLQRYLLTINSPYQSNIKGNYETNTTTYYLPKAIRDRGPKQTLNNSNDSNSKHYLCYISACGSLEPRSINNKEEERGTRSANVRFSKVPLKMKYL